MKSKRKCISHFERRLHSITCTHTFPGCLLTRGALQQLVLFPYDFGKKWHFSAVFMRLRILSSVFQEVDPWAQFHLGSVAWWQLVRSEPGMHQQETGRWQQRDVPVSVSFQYPVSHSVYLPPWAAPLGQSSLLCPSSPRGPVKLFALWLPIQG